MKKIFKFFFYLVLLLFFIITLLPKESLYNLLEHKLSNEEVIISNEKRDEKLFVLNVSDAKIYYEGINVAVIDKMSFSTFLFFNNINISNVKVGESLSRMIPSLIENIDIKYSVLDFKNVKIQSYGSFGEINGKLDIFAKKIILELKASPIMKRKYSKLLKQMKLIDGKYIWEKNL
ncbi:MULTISPECIES: hypothetical protein [Arcobacteraceae]|uniref:Uncharacterized protein n=1 Tax=Poseidonibacter parvus TaxID=1850254 RepID=A0A1P8KJ86_9BACT|nr:MULTISPECIES: hypothetical protein [Arcobacteraceae]APW64566.1 hypothetical protein LPB137_01295 [Poseidonibacter parvus]